MYNVSLRLAYISLMTLAFGIFTSISLSGLSHIMLAIPGIYFTYDFFIKERNYKKLNPSFWFLVAIIVSVGLSVVFNLDILEKPFNNFSKAKYFLMTIFGIFSFSKVLGGEDREKKVKILLWVFVIATTVASLSGIIGLLVGFNPLKMKAGCHTQRACGLYGMYMTYGYGISLFLILNTGLLIYRDQVEQYIATKWLAIAWVINFLGLFLSYTRGGWIAFFLAVPFFFFKSNKKKFLSIVGIVSIVFGLSFVFVPKLKKMFLNRRGSNVERLAFYETAYRVFREYRVVGIGFRNFEPNVKKFKKKYNIAFASFSGHAHSNYLEYLATTGLIGFSAFVFFLLSWLREVYKRDDLIALLTLPFIINFAISGLFQTTFGDGENLFLILGVYTISQLKSLELA